MVHGDNMSNNPDSPGTAVDHASLRYAAHLIKSADHDLPVVEAWVHGPDDATAVVLRGHLTAFSSIAHKRGKTDEEIAAMLDGYAARIRSGEASANARKWIGEIMAVAREEAAADGVGEAP